MPTARAPETRHVDFGRDFGCPVHRVVRCTICGPVTPNPADDGKRIIRGTTS